MPEFRHFSNLVSLLPSLNPDEDRFSRHQADVENSFAGASAIVIRIQLVKGDPQFLRERIFPGLKVSEKSLGYLDSLKDFYKPFLDATNKVQNKYYGSSGSGITSKDKLSDYDDSDIKQLFGFKYNPGYYLKSRWYVTEITRGLINDNPQLKKEIVKNWHNVVMGNLDKIFNYIPQTVKDGGVDEFQQWVADLTTFDAEGDDESGEFGMGGDHWKT